MIERYGLRQDEIRKVIMSEVTKNPDLKYYINDDYIYMLVDAIVDGVSKAISEQTREVFNQIEIEARMR